MNRCSIKIALYACMALCIPALAPAQKSRKELEARKKRLLHEMAGLNKMLNKTTDNKEVSLTQLITLNKQISVRQDIITTVNNEVGLLQSEINADNSSIDSMQTHVNALKKQYAQMIVDAYKTNHAYSNLMFIFAAHNFEQAVLRMRYLQEYEEYRHRQAIIIDSAEKQLNLNVQALQKKKDEKQQLLQGQQQQKQKLASEKAGQQKIFTRLQGKEKKLRRQIAQKQRAAKKLDNAIHKIIEEEMKRLSAANKSHHGTTGNAEMNLTPEAKALSKSFEGNKGNLPWPVVEGVVYRQFGTYSPLPGITLTDNGIDIATTKGAIVRSVFKGTVSAIVNLPSSGKVVMIRHGEYISVYAHLKEVFVKKGQKVDTKQSLGTLLFDKDEGKTLLQFEIWKGQAKLDPQDWLFSKN